MGIVETNMETSVMGYIGHMLGLYRVLYRDNGKDNRNYCIIMGSIMGII